MRKKAKLLNIKRLPMDLAKFIYLFTAIFFRVKKLTPSGKKYKGFLRGGAVIAANHNSFADPFIVGVTFWYRRLFFMVAEAVMVGKFRVAALTGAGAIKINRYETDLESIKRSVQVLKEGQLLSVFPQGGIHKNEDVTVNQMKSGVALLALQADVPIIPMYIHPRKRWYHRYVVVIGQPVNPRDHITKKVPTTGDINNLTSVVFEEMNRCALHLSEGIL